MTDVSLTNPHQLHKYGTILLWAGILVWAPYFVVRIIGESPSLLMYLPFHLLGVIGGARMRTNANKQLGNPLKSEEDTNGLHSTLSSQASLFGFHTML